jgi:hypothetical protein
MMNLFRHLSSLLPIPGLDFQYPQRKFRSTMDRKGKQLSPTLQYYIRQVYLRILEQQ